MKKTLPKLSGSPAYQLVALVWAQTAFRSWIRLNHTMQDALLLAIKAGLRFAKDDIGSIFGRFRGSYWFGADSERFYRCAVEAGNTSACQSWEHWVGRPPFLLKGRRLYVGAEIPAKKGAQGGPQEEARDGGSVSYDPPGMDGPMAVANVSCPSCRAEPGEDCVPHAFKHQSPHMEMGVHVSRISAYRRSLRYPEAKPTNDVEKALLSPDGGKPTRFLVDRVFDFFFGPDPGDAINDALDADERHAKEGVATIRRADYTVEVVYDEATQLFGARLKTKTRNLDVDAEGATPGEALTYVGMLIDTSLVRRGFKRRKR